MDVMTIGAAIAIAKSLPDTAVGQAVAAAERAESAAETAVEYGQLITIEDDVLIIGEEGE